MVAQTGIGLPGTGTGGASAVANDHIFPSTTARDAYFQASEARLAELITGTPIVVTISGSPTFQTWAATTPARIADYSATNWMSQDAISGARVLALLNAMPAISVQTQTQSDTTDSVSGLTVGRIPTATANGLVDSPARMSGTRVFVPELEVESGTVRVGNIVALSEATGFVALNNQLDNTQFTLTDFATPPNAPSGRPRRLAFTAGQSRLDLQVNVSENLTADEITSDYVTAQLGRTNQIVLFSSSAVTNLRVRVENVTPGSPIPVKFIPSRMAWEDGTGGLDFTPGGELLLDITDSPMVFGTNRTLRITVRKDSGTLLGSGGQPAVAVLFQPGVFVDSADLDDVPDNIGDLDDVPATRGTAGQYLRVNTLGTSLEYASLPAGSEGGVFVGDDGSFFPNRVDRLDAGQGLQFSLSGTDTGRLALMASIGLLDDVPNTRGSSGQILAVNTAGTALEYINSPAADASITNWFHAELPTGRLPQRTRSWYRHTGAADVVRDMPTTTNLPSGWHTWVANETTNTTVTLRGAFGGNLTQIILAEQEGCYLGWNGTQFVEGARRNRITTSNLANWQGNPLIPGNSYVTRGGVSFSAGNSSFNMEMTGVTTDMLNRHVCVQAPGTYRIDVPTLASENRTVIPVSEGYGFANNGGGILTIAPRSVDEIAMGATRYRGQSPMLLAFGAAVTFTRTNDNLYTVTSSVGTITGGV